MHQVRWKEVDAEVEQALDQTHQPASPSSEPLIALM